MSELGDILLPQTATDLAKALDLLEARLFGLPVEAIAKQPATAPSQYLDHLAWEYSVDVWNSGWSDAFKRSAITGAMDVHLVKGTPASIRYVLQTLGASLELEEWWQSGSDLDPGEFIVGIFPSANLYQPDAAVIDAQTIADMRAAVLRVIPVSRRAYFRVGVAQQVGPNVGGLVAIGVDLRLTYQPANILVNGGVVVVQPRIVLSQDHVPLRPAAVISETQIR